MYQNLFMSHPFSLYHSYLQHSSLLLSTKVLENKGGASQVEKAGSKITVSKGKLHSSSPQSTRCQGVKTDKVVGQ